MTIYKVEAESKPNANAAALESLLIVLETYDMADAVKRGWSKAEDVLTAITKFSVTDMGDVPKAVEEKA